jgi:hypothetical protein
VRRDLLPELLTAGDALHPETLRAALKYVESQAPGA